MPEKLHLQFHFEIEINIRIPVIDKTKESFDDVAHVESTEMEIL